MSFKDRNGSQILTHNSADIKTAKTITTQETEKLKNQHIKVHVPELAKDFLEQVAFEALQSEYIDYKSGVSPRLSITAYENLISTAERRAIMNNYLETTIRSIDLIGIILSITGKVELVYEGEQQNTSFVANHLISEVLFFNPTIP